MPSSKSQWLKALQLGFGRTLDPVQLKGLDDLIARMRSPDFWSDSLPVLDLKVRDDWELALDLSRAIIRGVMTDEVFVLGLFEGHVPVRVPAKDVAENWDSAIDVRHDEDLIVVDSAQSMLLHFEIVYLGRVEQYELTLRDL
jgi:hypothetical protein